MSKCLQVCLILTFRYSNLKSKYWKRCEVFCAKILCVSAGSCQYVDWFWEMSTKLIYRYQNKQFTIFHSTVYYIKTITVRIMRLNRFMYYNNYKFQKRLMAIQPCLFLLFERTTTSLSLAKLNPHIIKRYVKAIFGEYLVN